SSRRRHTRFSRDWSSDVCSSDLDLSGNWDWDKLRKQVIKHGVRNSLLVAPMPTASTSQILGNNECFEPYTSNIYTRRVLSGEFRSEERRVGKECRCVWLPEHKNK